MHCGPREQWVEPLGRLGYHLEGSVVVVVVVVATVVAPVLVVAVGPGFTGLEFLVIGLLVGECVGWNEGVVVVGGFVGDFVVGPLVGGTVVAGP